MRSGLRSGKGSADGSAVLSSPSGFAWEVLVTGLKWYDVRTGQGGGGGIDLVMYLLGIDFVAAVKFLVGADAAGQRRQICI